MEMTTDLQSLASDYSNGSFKDINDTYEHQAGDLVLKPKKRSSHLLKRSKALHLKDFLNILASLVE